MVASASAMARADTLNFVLITQGNTIDFSLPSSPDASSSSPAHRVQFDNVAMTINGVAQTQDVSFFTHDRGGGLQVGNDALYLSGAQLFKGSVFRPTFSPGGFTLTSASDDGSTAASLVIALAGASPSSPLSSPAVSTVPEPSSFLLTAGAMALLAAMGVRSYYRKRHKHPPVSMAGDATLGEES
jgi:hypothetical protein